MRDGNHLESVPYDPRAVGLVLGGGADELVRAAHGTSCPFSRAQSRRRKYLGEGTCAVLQWRATGKDEGMRQLWSRPDL